MTTVAKRAIGTVFASAKINGLRPFGGELHGRKFSGFMTAITKRLILA
jgi:hypothetical protein